MEAGRDLLTL